MVVELYFAVVANVYAFGEFLIMALIFSAKRLVDDIKKEHLNPFCQCCLAEDNLLSMTQSHVFDNCIDVYSEMLFACFSIQLVHNEEGSYYICNNCAYKLRQSCSFRRQVEDTQIGLKLFTNHGTQTQFSVSSANESSKVSVAFEKTISSSRPYRKVKSDKSNFLHPNNSNSTLKLKIDIGIQTDKFEQCDNEEENKSIDYCNDYDDSQSLHIKTESDISDDDSIPLKMIKNHLSETLGPKRQSKLQKIRLEKPVKTKKLDLPIQPWISSPLKFDEKTCICTLCNQTFKGQKPLTAHMGRFHFPNFICDLCGKSFVGRKNLNAHQSKTHNDNMIQCKICNKLLKKNSILRHEMGHSVRNKNVYACPMCPERFDSFFRRIKHLKVIHNKAHYKYECKFCPKSYLMASGLSRHVRSYHLQEKTLPCEVCGLMFFSKGDRSDHMVKHNAPRIYACHICPKSYARKKTLTEHLKIHDPHKRHKCTICRRKFTQKCTMMAHMKVHEKEPALKEVFYDDVIGGSRETNL